MFAFRDATFRFHFPSRESLLFPLSLFKSPLEGESLLSLSPSLSLYITVSKNFPSHPLSTRCLLFHPIFYYSLPVPHGKHAYMMILWWWSYDSSMMIISLPPQSNPVSSVTSSCLEKILIKTDPCLVFTNHCLISSQVSGQERERKGERGRERERKKESFIHVNMTREWWQVTVSWKHTAQILSLFPDCFSLLPALKCNENKI